MAFHFEELEVPGVVEIIPDVFGDERGGFAEMFRDSLFRAQGITGSFVQVNYSRSSKNVLRGLHYQVSPYEQGKLVTVLSGVIFDVGVDIREGSGTFGKWAGRTLTAEKKNLLWIPPGLAHGFCVTSETAEVMYFVTGSEYAPEAERGIIWNDETLNITWPTREPVLSGKDKLFPSL